MSAAEGFCPPVPGQVVPPREIKEKAHALPSGARAGEILCLDTGSADCITEKHRWYFLPRYVIMYIEHFTGNTGELGCEDVKAGLELTKGRDVYDYTFYCQVLSVLSKVYGQWN